jgi:hypothetical protein
LKKIEKTGTGIENVTVYAGISETRNWQATGEEVQNYPTGDTRWKNGPAAASFVRSAMHVDQLGSAIAISDAAGILTNKRAYSVYE